MAECVEKQQKTGGGGAGKKFEKKGNLRDTIGICIVLRWKAI